MSIIHTGGGGHKQEDPWNSSASLAELNSKFSERCSLRNKVRGEGVIEEDIGLEPLPSTWPHMDMNVVLGEKAVLRENLPARVLKK